MGKEKQRPEREATELETPERGRAGFWLRRRPNRFHGTLRPVLIFRPLGRGSRPRFYCVNYLAEHLVSSLHLPSLLV